MNLPSPICLARAIWRSLTRGALWSGCNFVTHPEPTPPNVHVLECEDCGNVTMAWSWDSMEGEK